MAGAEYGVRGFIDAYDAQTGRAAGGSSRRRGRRIRATARGGAPTRKPWEKAADRRGRAGAYDPELNLVYWGTGNAGPDYDGSAREATTSTPPRSSALDADTGRLRWHYQFTPHDVGLGLDAEPVLADLTIGGQSRAQDRDVREPQWLLLRARPRDRAADSGRSRSSRRAGRRRVQPNGRPMLLPEQHAERRGTRVCPDQAAGPTGCRRRSTRSSGSCSSRRGSRAASSTPGRTTTIPATAFSGGAVSASAIRRLARDRRHRPVKSAGTFPTPPNHRAGVLSTASGLVFAGSSGNFMAFDGRTGKNLWHFQTGSALYAGAITYMLDGRQYVLLPSGTTLTAYALPGSSEIARLKASRYGDRVEREPFKGETFRTRRSQSTQRNAR